MKEVKCPSGAILKINPAPFKESHDLYKAVLREAKHIQFSKKTELPTLYKDLFCAGFSSEEIEVKLWACMKRCTYNSGNGDLKIDEASFEKVETRDDFMMVCMEVAKENIHPFVKSLYAEYVQAIATTESTQA